MAIPTLKLTSVLALAAVVLLAMVIARPLLAIDETRYLAVAWEMHLSGDPLHLTRNFETYTHKPPLLFWLINLVWLVTGVGELAGRLVGPACTLGVIAGTAMLARRLWRDDAHTGWHVAAALTAFSVFMIYGSATMFDALLTLAVLLGMSAIWRIGTGEAATRRPWMVLGLAIALGVYAKGPVILVHLIPVLILIRLWSDDPPPLRAILRGVALSVGLALVLLALWLVPVLVTGDAAFRHELLWTQSAARVGGGLAHDRPFWFLAALLPILLFPWGWSWRIWGGMGTAVRGDGALRFCAIWALSGLILFSAISGKQAHYLIPEFPALALIVGRRLALSATLGRGGSLAPAVAIVLGAALVALGVGLVPLQGDLVDLVPGWPVALAGLALAGMGIVATRLPSLTAHLALGLAVPLALHATIAGTALYPTHDGRGIASRLAPYAEDGIAVVGMTYNADFNFAARMDRRVATPSTGAELTEWAAKHPDGVIVGPVERAGITAPAQDTVRYYRKDMGVWPASAATGAETGATFPESAPAD
jgi:4-amino-4-deoxy-L-arabinose transferase-like glycosyltransferase